MEQVGHGVGHRDGLVARVDPHAPSVERVEEGLEDRPLVAEEARLGDSEGDGEALEEPTLLVSPGGETVQTARDREGEVGGFVLGLPVGMDGTEGPSAQSARQFGLNLLKQAALFEQEPEIAFWDERMSTMAVTRTLLEADASRKRRGEVVGDGPPAGGRVDADALRW